VKDGNGHPTSANFSQVNSAKSQTTQNGHIAKRDIMNKNWVSRNFGIFTVIFQDYTPSFLKYRAVILITYVEHIPNTLYVILIGSYPPHPNAP
jgi:hypothetical protein